MKLLTTLLLGAGAYYLYAESQKKKVTPDPILGGDPVDALEGLGSNFVMSGPAISSNGGHTHKTPCCNNCAHGLSCAG